MTTRDLPELIPIARDDYHAKHVGRRADGTQFFVTEPFVPAGATSAGREFISVYLFDRAGALLEARIDDLGPRAGVDPDAARALLERRIDELGPITFEDIDVRPFSVERHGVLFGLIPSAPEDDGENGGWIEVQPGNYTAFREPWDGTYDT